MTFTKEYNKKIRALKSNKPKDYWNLLKNAEKRKECSSKISIDIFMEHFKKLNENENNERTEQFDPRNVDHSTNEELNKFFTTLEVKQQISKLKNNKACGIDYVINEFIKNSPEKMVEVLVKLFNLVLETGLIPTDWTIGIIKPLYKNKGSPDNPDNYRGITLLSCIGKCFTAVINARLTKYLDALGYIGEEQAGFREGYSTLDHIFVLYSIISLYQQKNKKVYCAFIDYKKAFDLIDRSSLWAKLISYNINGKLITVIYNLYANAKSCVLNNDAKSNYFNCNIGVRQGENLSPLLFAIYLNDFDYFISRKYAGLSQLSHEFKHFLSDDDVEVYLNIFSLLYADDTIVLAENAYELQKALSAVYDYCNEWHLTVNTSKTKVVIFSKGKVRRHPIFRFGENTIDVVDDYVYLGCMFNYNNKFDKTKSKQINQANRAMFSLLSKVKKLDLPVDIVLELFHQLVTPILLYGCEIWGVEECKKIDTFYMKFCKHLLKVNKNTSNCKVLGELGSKNLRQVIDNRLLNFWLRLKNGKSSKLSCTMYKLLVNMANANTYISPWLSKVVSLLNNLGLSNLFYETNVNTLWFKKAVTLRISDVFKQNWSSEVDESGSCLNYKIFKHELACEKYLSVLDFKDRISLTKFRCGSNRLPVTVGRYTGIPRHERFCTLCNNQEIGDEYHYLFECNVLRNERIKYIAHHYRNRPNTLKMSQLFNSTNIPEIRKLSKMCQCIMNHF